MITMRIPQLSRRKRVGAAVAGVLAFAAVLQTFNANPAASQTLALTAFETGEDPGLEASSPVWRRATGVTIPLTAQAATYSQGGGSIATVAAKAVHYKGQLYVRVEWQDLTPDQSTARVEDFSDAVALEFPSRGGASVPSVCMGQAGSGVNIWHWRADSQAGFKDPADVFEGSQVDPSPTAFYTARDAGNPYSNPEFGPVQTLVAYAFGTLSPASVQDVAGRGERVGDKYWAVVFARPFSSTGIDQAEFGNGRRTDMAIAVWNGSEGDRNGRKSVSQFVTLSIAGSSLPDAPGSADDSGVLVLAGALFVTITAIGVGFATYGYNEGGRP